MNSVLFFDVATSNQSLSTHLLRQPSFCTSLSNIKMFSAVATRSCNNVSESKISVHCGLSPFGRNWSGPGTIIIDSDVSGHSCRSFCAITRTNFRAAGPPVALPFNGALTLRLDQGGAQTCRNVRRGVAMTTEWM